MNKGKVFLIGAGPGDPGLFTLKGKKCLEKADVIVYDFLVNQKIINYSRKETEILYVGKKSGHHEISQNVINKILIDRAKKGKIVVRLKGGDPFIFGRGGEEAEVLSTHGIDFEVVPGVPSPSSVPAYAGIPLTHRKLSSSFAVITGNKDTGQATGEHPWEALAKLGTIVILMGVEKVEQNLRKLIENGKSPKTPAAIISWGTLPKQQTVTGTLETISDLARKKGVKPPGVIVVGDVVKLREKILWFEKKPLFGKRILVTRSKEQSESFVNLLEDLGAEVIVFPTIEIFPPEEWGSLDRALESLNRYDWIIFTSANGVRFFFYRLKTVGRDLRELKGVKIVAIGEQTAKAVEKHDLRIEMIPSDFRAEGIIEAFSNVDLKNNCILIPRARIARDLLPNELRKMGAEVDVVTAYETKKPRLKHISNIKEMFKLGLIDIVTFTSSSTVRNFMALFGNDKNLLKKSKIACIGPVTASTAKEIGIKPQIVCKKYTIEEMTREIADYYKYKRSRNAKVSNK